MFSSPLCLKLCLLCASALLLSSQQEVTPGNAMGDLTGFADIIRLAQEGLFGELTPDGNRDFDLRRLWETADAFACRCFCFSQPFVINQWGKYMLGASADLIVGTDSRAFPIKKRQRKIEVLPSNNLSPYMLERVDDSLREFLTGFLLKKPAPGQSFGLQVFDGPVASTRISEKIRNGNLRCVHECPLNAHNLFLGNELFPQLNRRLPFGIYRVNEFITLPIQTADLHPLFSNSLFGRSLKEHLGREDTPSCVEIANGFKGELTTWKELEEKGDVWSTQPKKSPRQPSQMTSYQGVSSSTIDLRPEEVILSHLQNSHVQHSYWIQKLPAIFTFELSKQHEFKCAANVKKGKFIVDECNLWEMKGGVPKFLDIALDLNNLARLKAAVRVHLDDHWLPEALKSVPNLETQTGAKEDVYAMNLYFVVQTVGACWTERFYADTFHRNNAVFFLTSLLFVELFQIDVDDPVMVKAEPRPTVLLEIVADLLSYISSNAFDDHRKRLRTDFPGTSEAINKILIEEALLHQPPSLNRNVCPLDPSADQIVVVNLRDDKPYFYFYPWDPPETPCRSQVAHGPDPKRLAAAIALTCSHVALPGVTLDVFRADFDKSKRVVCRHDNALKKYAFKELALRKKRP